MNSGKPLLNDLIIRSHHTAVSVSNFDEALKFYIDFLGFECIGEIRDRGEPGFADATGVPDGKAHWAMLKSENYHIELFEWLNPKGKTQKIRQCDLGYTHIALQVKDVEDAYERVIKAGFKTLSPPVTLRNGVAKVIYVVAPENNITELVEYKE
tara:strand:- start:4985 stop:5446 length:462 start_codon:yes stop_codon:yes gene_type:complete